MIDYTDNNYDDVYADTNDDDDDDDDDGTTSYAPPPGSLRPNELSDVEEKAHYLPIATFFWIKFWKIGIRNITFLMQPFFRIKFWKISI